MSATIRRLALAAGVALAAALAAASTAAADFAFEPGSFTARMHDAAGQDVTQAGAHPDATVDFSFTSAVNHNGRRIPSGSVKDIAVELPRGVVGDPLATPRCRHADFMAYACARETIVGVETLEYTAYPGLPMQRVVSPLFNITPPDGTVARFGFQMASVLVTMDVRVRSDGGYNLVAELGGLSEVFQVYRSTLTLWGVPADRNGPGPFRFTGSGALTYGGPGTGPRKPFLTNPSVCGAPPVTTIRATAWQRPDRPIHDSYTSASGVTGCERLAFASSLELRSESPRAGVPAPYEVRLAVPQSGDPDGLATPPVRDVTVTLPEGVAVSPSSADGLVGCTDAQAALGSAQRPACPDASKIGAVAIETPVLPGPLTGAIFLGQPKSMDAQSGEMLRILVIASGHGVTVKLPGRITPDPVSGRLRAVFSDNPQLPFSLLTMRFQGGPKAPLTNPRACGTHTTSAAVASWGGQTAASDSSFAIAQSAAGGPCGPLGFAPSFGAGMTSSAAGAFGGFSLTFGRDDAQQDLGALDVALPRGLTGLIASADLCPDAAAAVGACAAGARIGGVSVAAGAGLSPLQLEGEGVYVTGPYKGAPFGLAIVVRADAGPYRLGTVVVRAAIHVDRRTAALRIVSDPLPTILQGIPLRIRAVHVRIDRPGFMLNPTSCARKAVAATIRSAQGAAANAAQRFQVGGCRELPYAPRLLLRVGGRGRTAEGLTTPFSATLRIGRGQANNRAITVKLPKLLNARMSVVNDACTLEEFEGGRCTKQVGTAVALTPLLRDPLRGPAYFVRNPARRLPDLMVALKGQGRGAGVAIDLAGKVTIPRDLSLRTAFDTIPDVPISMFRLSLVAGRRGAIGTTASLCSAAARRASAQIGFRAQSGRLTQVRRRLRIAGCAQRAARAAQSPGAWPAANRSIPRSAASRTGRSVSRLRSNSSGV